MWLEAYSGGRAAAGAVRSLTVPRSPLVISLLPLPPLAGGSVTPVGVGISNTSSILDADQAVASLTLTPPGGAGATVSTTFGLVAGVAQVVDLPLAVPPLEFGNYTVEVRTSDAYGERHESTVWPSTPGVQGTLDQPSYRARDVAQLELALSNPGPFVLPLDLTVDSALGFSGSRSVILQPYVDETVVFAVPIPAALASGSRAVTATIQLPSGAARAIAMPALQVPPSELSFALASASVAAGGPLELVVTNEGGVDTTAQVELSLVDARGVSVTGHSGAAPVLAGQSDTVTIAVPAGVADGGYTLSGTVADESTAVEQKVFKLVMVQGSAASLTVATDEPAYLASEVMEFSATLANGPQALDDGTLTWRVTQPAGERVDLEPEIVPYTVDNSGINSRYINDVAVDGEGNVWFATETYWDGAVRDYVGGGVNVLSPDGSWTSYTAADSGLSDDIVYAVAVGSDGSAWFGPDAGGLDVRLADGTWQRFTAADSDLAGEWVSDIAVDTFGNVWIAYDGDEGVSVRRTDGSWETYTTVNSGICSNEIYALEADHAGNVWFAPREEGVCVRRADGSWTTYTAANSGLDYDRVFSLAAAPNGDVWFGYCGTGNAATVLRAGGSWWEDFEYPDMPGEYLSCTPAIDVDLEGNVWFGFSGDSDFVSV
ncbi:MAG: hypothetical protein E3J64_06400, partial [Anaerolineales bacterium]